MIIGFIMKTEEGRNTSKVVRDLITLMDSVNSFIDENKPWVIAKMAKNGSAESDLLHYILSASLYFFAKSKSLWSCAGQPNTAPNP